MTTRNLLIVFLFLLGIYGLSQFFIKKSATSFQANLIQIDTTQVTSIVIIPKSATPDINLQRTAKGWQVTRDNVTSPALSEEVQLALAQIVEVKSTRIASNDVKEWKNYGLEDHATRVKIFQEDNLLEDFFVGQALSSSQTQIDTAYIRLANENEVYVVKQFLTEIFAKEFDAYRQRAVIKLAKPQQINQLLYTGVVRDTLSRVIAEWRFGQGVVADSNVITNYLHEIRNINATAFADSFNETKMGSLPTEKLIIQGDNIATYIQIIAYCDSTIVPPYIIHSSQFPDAFYASDSSGIYQLLFGVFKQSKTEAIVD